MQFTRVASEAGDVIYCQVSRNSWFLSLIPPLIRQELELENFPKSKATKKLAPDFEDQPTFDAGTSLVELMFSTCPGNLVKISIFEINPIANGVSVHFSRRAT